MPLTTAEQVRLRISDRWRYAEEVRVGDGSASGFKLAQGAPFSNLSAASAYIGTGAGGWSATGATINTGLGLLTFSAIISANSAWRADYQWALFGDEEIGYFTAIGGTVAGAALEAVKTLMFDSLRRARWMAPDGTQYDDTQAMQQLQKLYEQLDDEVNLRTPAGGFESWGEQQEYYQGPYSTTQDS